MIITRRHAALVGASAVLVRPHNRIRLAVLTYGSIRWLLKAIDYYHLDMDIGLHVDTVPVASAVSPILLLANYVDVITTDWFFVAFQRTAGRNLSFLPFSSASGGLYGTVKLLPELTRKRLGVAGNALDKSWLIMRAAAQQQQHFDIANAPDVGFAPPPMLTGLVQAGHLDAALTYWNFVPQLELLGLKSIYSVADAAQDLGIDRHLSLIGFAFDRGWAMSDGSTAFTKFQLCVTEACSRLRSDHAVWSAVRPLMNAKSDAEYSRLRARFSDGLIVASPEDQERDAKRLFDVVKQFGLQATGGVEHWPNDVFWR